MFIINFESEEEYKEFIHIATRIRLLKEANVPIPKEVLEMLEANKDSSDVYYVLNEIAKE